MERLFLIFLIVPIVSLAQKKLPESLGEMNSGYTYIPIDPLPVFQGFGNSCEDDQAQWQELLASLPDQTVRIAIAERSKSGSISFGPVSVGGKSKNYDVILDYISVDATQLPVYVKRTISSGTNKGEVVSIYDNSIRVETNYFVSGAKRYGNKGSELKLEPETKDGELVVIPVYIGLGLRLTASIHMKKGGVNLSGLGSLAAGAESGKLNGNLTVQSIGITGNQVSTSLPLPSELNQTTIQNAILALGSIKAIIYDKDNTVLTPRVVGFYNPIGGGQQLINGIISTLAAEPIVWYRPCDNP